MIANGGAATDRDRNRLDSLLSQPIGHVTYEAGDGAGRGRIGVVPSRPLATGQDCCEWYTGGTAGEGT